MVTCKVIGYCLLALHGSIRTCGVNTTIFNLLSLEHFDVDFVILYRTAELEKETRRGYHS